MINDWKPPDTGQCFLSFVLLINFYHSFTPYLELKLNLLRSLCQTYHQKSIPTMAWTPDLIKIFGELKVEINSSPVLSRLDSQNNNFLNTNYSAQGMGWILMHPDNNI